MVARVSATPVPKDGYEANPLLSVPALVAEVQAARELSEDAAVLYLLDTLPPRADLARGADLERLDDRAGQEGCEGADGRRASSGGQALPRGARHLPAGWMGGAEGARAADPVRSAAGVRRPLGILLPLRPVHELFEAAWQRVKAGEQPGYEEVP